MIKLLNLEIYKQLCIIKNSKLKFLLGAILNIVILFIIINFNSNNSHEELFYIVAWYSVIWLIFAGLTQTSTIVNEEVKNNTIHKLILSPYGVNKILIIKLIVKSIISIFFINIILFMIQYLTSSINLYQLFQFSIINFIGLISINSIGIILGFLSLASQNIQIVITIIRISIIFSMIQFKSNIFIPFSYAKEMGLDLLILNKSISSFSIDFLVCFFINTLIYAIISFIISRYIEKKFLEKGTFIL